MHKEEPGNILAAALSSMHITRLVVFCFRCQDQSAAEQVVFKPQAKNIDKLCL